MAKNKNILSKKIAGYSLIIFLVLTIPIYYYKLRNDTRLSVSPNQNYEMIRKAINGKYIKSLHGIINEKTTNNKIVVFLYMGSDCGNCMKNGFRITHKINSLFGGQIVKVIATNTNISRDHILFNYDQYIYNDDSGVIRRELHFLYTPVFLILDSSYKVLEVNFLKLEDTPNEEEKFIDLLKVLLFKKI